MKGLGLTWLVAAEGVKLRASCLRKGFDCGLGLCGLGLRLCFRKSGMLFCLIALAWYGTPFAVKQPGLRNKQVYSFLTKSLTSVDHLDNFILDPLALGCFGFAGIRLLLRYLYLFLCVFAFGLALWLLRCSLFGLFAFGILAPIIRPVLKPWWCCA